MLDDDYLGAGVCCIYFHARSAAKSEGSDDADDDHGNDDGDNVVDDDDYGYQAYNSYYIDGESQWIKIISRCCFYFHDDVDDSDDGGYDHQ